MNSKLTSITKKLRPLITWLRRYGSFVIAILLLLIVGWLISRINTYNRREPDEQALANELQAIKRPRVDPEVVKKIQQLQDNSEEVQALFKQARDNPFQE